MTMLQRVSNGSISKYTRDDNLYLERRGTLTDEFGAEVGFGIPDINALDDICDAIDICDEYNVPYDGLDDLEDFKDRIRLHFIKSRRVESRKAELEKSIMKAAKDDANKRQKLKLVLDDLIKITEAHKNSSNRVGGGLVEGLLKTEGTSDDLEKDCKDRAEQIDKGECLLLVAGETSAGKSSVLNLLLEDDVLPVHTKSSTSVITIIRYGKKAHAKIVYKSDVPDKTFELDDVGMKDLHSIAFMESASERENHNVKEVQVYLPLKILKSGLVFVDTPGIGENEFLESELMNFIHDNVILGFIYIIKTDNAGGVQEDRLLNLLKIVIQKHRSNPSDPYYVQFNPKAALFICNRFDLVDKSAQNAVRENAINKLSQCWPNFDENQVIFFSTEKAKRDFEVDPDYINDNFKQFLECVRDLFITMVDRRIQVCYRWIDNILKRVTHFLKSVVKKLDYSDVELREKSESARTKLDNLKKKSEIVITSLEDEINIKAKDLCKTLREYISEPSVKGQLTSNWVIDDLPSPVSGLGNWEWIKIKIYEAFYDKMSVCIDEWDSDKDVLDTIETDMSLQIKMELNLLNEELSKIEKELQDDSSNDSSDYGSRGSLRRTRRISNVSIAALSPLRRPKNILGQPKLPIKLAGRLINPVRTFITNIRSKTKLDHFSKDPVKTAEEKAKEIYDELLSQPDTDGLGLQPFVECLLERPREYINILDRKIPHFILSNQMLLNLFQQSIREGRENQKEYEQMMTDVENLRRVLNDYGEGYIFVNDFMKNEVQIQRTNAEGEAVSIAFNIIDFLESDSMVADAVRKRDVHGLWTVTYSGMLVRNEIEMPISIRCYLPSSKVTSTYKEVAKLRCLTSQGGYIAEFLGIHHAETPTPAFIYGGSLKSVRRFLQSFCSRKESVPCLLEDTACGLEYLHKKGLVHMELSQDTVTVDENGEVQLTGGCLPREPNLPHDTESRETGNFVYLPPEVLGGQKYDAGADIYSFGLFIIELAVTYVQGCVFREQRKMTLCDFIRTVDPEEMLDFDGLLQDFTVKTRALIQNCLAMDKDDRPPIDEVVEYTFLIKDESDALDKLPSRHSRGRVVKRHGKNTSLSQR